MSYIAHRDIFGMESDDPILDKIDKLDDEVIRIYQQGFVDDEFLPGMTLEDARAYYKETGYIGCPFPEPNSFDTILILYKMIESGKVKFDV